MDKCLYSNPICMFYLEKNTVFLQMYLWHHTRGDVEFICYLYWAEIFYKSSIMLYFNKLTFLPNALDRITDNSTLFLKFLLSSHLPYCSPKFYIFFHSPHTLILFLNKRVNRIQSKYTFSMRLLNSDIVLAMRWLLANYKKWVHYYNWVTI